MSLGYAERLSWRDDLGGQLGAPETIESQEELEAHAKEVARLIRESRSTVAFTGAGISTACGIPDFRGPNGIWTLQQQGKPLPKCAVTFEFAKPSLTHMALLGLMRAGKLDYLVSQNVDGMHLRSGVDRARLAELHGNVFSERCPKCERMYYRDFDVGTVGFRGTGRSCASEGCRGRLRDHVLDWDQPLPDDELDESEARAQRADLSITLGTSLQIAPANDIPVMTARAGGSLVIVNLQKTPMDAFASLICRARADDLMRVVMRELGVPVPPFERWDAVVVTATWETSAMETRGTYRAAPRKKRKTSGGAGKGGESEVMTMRVRVSSVHGPECPVPMCEEVSFNIARGDDTVAVRCAKWPVEVSRRIERGELGGSRGETEAEEGDERKPVPGDNGEKMNGGINMADFVLELKMCSSADETRRRCTVRGALGWDLDGCSGAVRSVDGAEARLGDVQRVPHGWSQTLRVLTQVATYE
ncbi:unnamed protein product [Pedinophyceae sp. YPF-701]|nr:unnamed protein product [Pedinophyceae sp. YPF-701]